MRHGLALVVVCVLTLAACGQRAERRVGEPVPVGTLETVAELPINPGNVCVTPGGEIIASVHQFRTAPMKVMQVLADGSYEPWPSAEWNAATNPDGFVAVLGIYADQKNRVWVLDNGTTDVPVPPRLLAFDADTRELVFRHVFSEAIAAPGSFVQDLAVDPIHEYVFLADIGGAGEPAIIAVNIATRATRRLEAGAALAAEDVNMVIGGEVTRRPNPSTGVPEPVRVALNPITISHDCATIYFGAMTGTTWYAMPTDIWRGEATDSALVSAISRVGPKPVSDGAATDADGNHYFTDLNGNAITMLPSGTDSLVAIVSDSLLIWPDNVRFGPDGWLYISVNQLHLSPFFTGGDDRGTPPFRIMRVWTGTTSPLQPLTTL